MEIDDERDSTIFLMLYERAGDGESPVKLKSWKITLEFQTETQMKGQ